ncbi:histone PARylation factor 1 [Rhynchophorus ferrugineus]|uniref:histone PARylation factor 1 n=1 Tax=Rhynchophorus ferrugineus TaxID=354439 RepID=UPI003FCC53C6
MADSKFCSERQKYVEDPRIACQYGSKCYQKNSVHHQKYKHPPSKKRIRTDTENDVKRIKRDDVKKDADVELPENHSKTADPDLNTDKSDLGYERNESNEEVTSSNEDVPKTRTAKQFDPANFIKQKFLVDMPSDFYAFWDFCKGLCPSEPENALKDVGLQLVGPYDVLAGKFYNIDEPSEADYLIHWRYFYDPPEFQTILKGDDKTGFHIGYFRDSPEDLPVFLASNCSKTDGILKIVGDNIFAAVSIYLDHFKKTGDPFKKMHVSKFQSTLKNKAEELKLSLSERTAKIKERDRKIVSRSFNKVGIIVPYDRKTQTGYRDLGVSNKSLTKMLTNIQKALPEQRPKFLSELQSVLTNASIATDECDFGTGIELGLSILAHGVDSLDKTIARFLASNYRLIGREAFAKIAEAHMKNRRKETNLSIIK